MRGQIIIFFLTISLFHGLLLQGQVNSFERAYGKTAKLLYKTLQKYHYKPIQLNDEVADAIYQRFIYNLDPESIYFTSQELQQLAVNKLQIDEEIKAGEAVFLMQAMETYRLALHRMNKVASDLAGQPIDFQIGNGVFNTSKMVLHDSLFALQADLAARVQSYIHSNVLKRAFADISEGKPSITRLDSALKARGNEYQQRICQQLQQLTKNRIKVLAMQDNLVSNYFFSAITEQYDPHTNYFSFSEKSLFDTSLSEEEQSYGFSFGENKEGLLKITSLRPGGPAWKSNELHQGDILLMLKIEGRQELDLSLITPIRLQTVLDSLDTEVIWLTVKKKSEVQKTVRLVKETLSNENNVISSFILEGEKKIGYISLPSFYSDLENESIKGCANDVATQLIALKREDIDGLIIDLRNNGGGSVKEAINMVGMFIDVGPVLIEQDSEGELQSRKDFNRGTIYDGPMVVLNNKFSASASEIFAAALQDYHRAIIVGGTTYGKATGQIILPISEDITSELINAWMTGNDMGFVKVTIGKIFRITGKTHQLSGVIPDIPLYQATDLFMIGEHYYPTALASDSVYKKVYARPLPPLPIAALAQKSLARQAAHPKYQEIMRLTKGIEQRTPTPIARIPLGIEAFYAYWMKVRGSIAMIDLAATQEVSTFNVALSPLDKELLAVAPAGEDVYNIRMAKLLKDIDLEEAYRIIQDFILIK